MPFARRNFLFGIASLPASSLLAGRPLPGLTATVYNGYELHTALQAAGPGSTILLAPGNFGDIGRFVLASSSVSVRVQAPLKTVLRSRMIVDGAFVDLDGLGFENGLELIGTGVTIANSNFRGDGIDVRGVNAVVSGNEIGNYRGRGITVYSSATNCTVRNNYIHDSSRGDAHANAGIQVGISMQDSERNVNALIENNRIERVDAGPEALGIKSSGNTIRGNTLRDSKANITNRHGHGNVYQGNVVERSYGIVIHDRGNKLIGNRAVNPLQGRDFRVMGGNIPADSNRQGGHPQASGTIVQGNTGSLVIGSQFPGHRLPAVGTQVLSHNGPIELKAHTGTRLPSGANVSRDDDGNGGGNGGGRGGNNGGNGGGDGGGRGGGNDRDDDDRDGRRRANGRGDRDDDDDRGGRRRRRRRRRNGGDNSAAA